jgi:nitrite reductase/ring-hydroxylating ferredoxin subunit/uncharacterized membrane protein
MHDTRVLAAVQRIEEQEFLDVAARALSPLIQRVTRDDRVKRVLSGAPLGHRLHPVLTDLPIGTWTAATLVDLLAWRSGERAARVLVASGIVASVPTALTGLSDWDDTTGRDRRVGVAHAASNSVALLVQVASWNARRKHHHIRGAVLSAAALGALSVGGYLGGHLAFARRVGVDHEVPVVSDDGWHTVCRVDELVENEPIGVTVEGARVALVQRFGKIYALAAVCSHAGGPLDRGTVRGDALVCPWHGSAFSLDDGMVERGPATSPQPAYETRRRGDYVEVRAAPLDTRSLAQAGSTSRS